MFSSTQQTHSAIYLQENLARLSRQESDYGVAYIQELLTLFHHAYDYDSLTTEFVFNILIELNAVVTKTPLYVHAILPHLEDVYDKAKEKNALNPLAYVILLKLLIDPYESYKKTNDYKRNSNPNLNYLSILYPFFEKIFTNINESQFPWDQACQEEVENYHRLIKDAGGFRVSLFLQRSRNETQADKFNMNNNPTLPRYKTSARLFVKTDLEIGDEEVRGLEPWEESAAAISWECDSPRKR